MVEWPCMYPSSPEGVPSSLGTPSGPIHKRRTPGSSLCRQPRLQDDLGEAVAPLIEVLVGVGRLCEREPVADHEAGPGAACDDQVAQVLVVPLDRCLTHAKRE